MTLEDFFTLTEIKDGFTAISRVEDLVSVIQGSKDFIVKNAGDASRQWAAVASTIAATKNRECLDAFIRLDGLSYFSTWLVDAQRLASDSTDNSIEESILALLQALENLGVDGPKLSHSGIWHTVKKLVDHGSSRIQDLARKLCDTWKHDNVYDRSGCEDESINRLQEDEMRMVAVNGGSSELIPDANSLHSRENYMENPLPGAVNEVGSLLSERSEENKPGNIKGLEPQNVEVGFNSNVMPHCSITKADASDGTHTDEIMNAVEETFSLKENDASTVCSNLPAGNSDLPHPHHDRVGRTSDSPPAAEVCKDEKQIGGHGLSTEDMSAAVVTVASMSTEVVAVSSEPVVVSTEEIQKEPLLQKDLDSEEVSRNSSGVLEDVGPTHNCSKQVAPLTHINENYGFDSFSRLSGAADSHGKDEGFGMSDHADDEVKMDEKDANIKKKVKRRKKHPSRLMTVSQRLGVIDKTTADIELGIVDALEVATKVAQEVAREVDSREASFNSSEEQSVESGQSGSSDFINEEQDTLGQSLSKDAPAGVKPSVEVPQGGRGLLMGMTDNTPENGMSGNEIEPCQVSTEKSPCDFDLNEEICLDETDVLSSIPNPTPAVTVSRPVAAPGVPPAMVSQLERTVGWKGSAVTSAFHPASPHKVSGGYLREKQVCLDIDLNVAEGGDEKVEDSTPWKRFPFSSNVKSTETPVAQKPAESCRFNLDLNCTNEEDDSPSPSEFRMETRLFLNRNGHPSASPASSSAHQFVKKVNIDLNDGAQILMDSSEHGLYYGRHPLSTIPHGGHKLDEPVISLLGAKVEVKRKDSTLYSFLSNRKPLDPTLDLNIARTGNPQAFTAGMSYAPSSTYSYNGLTGTPGLSFTSPMYVPGNSIPYIMDSRGAPVMMPQGIGSAPHVQPAHAQHFFMSMPGASHSLNGLGPMRPNFDRGSGFEVGGNKETVSLRQFMSPGKSGPVGEHVGGSTESSFGSSIIGGKRKEPETGWEPYTHNPRPQYPPWR